jgi:Na+/melibiose symporter-like transporter
VAVALLAAGVVISYTNVIGGGIESMTTGLKSLTSFDLGAGISAIVGGVINLIVALVVAGFGISVTFNVMDKLTTDINEKDELRGGNIAIGVVYAGILVGVSQMISAGVTGIGGALTKLIDSLI